MAEHHPPVILYGPAIHQCIARGDLNEMKKLVNQAEQHLKDHGDVRSSLELLKAEIAKMEAKSK